MTYEREKEKGRYKGEREIERGRENKPVQSIA